MTGIRLLLADDHVLVREGMQAILSENAMISEIYQASNGHEAVLLASEKKPDVVVMDYEMPNFDGIYATKQIRKEYDDIPVLIVSAYRLREYVLESIKAGASGYLPKDAPIDELFEAIKSLAKGGTWFKGSIAELIAPMLVEQIGRSDRFGSARKNGALTSREREVVKLFSEGKTAKDIAGLLSISKRTVDVHKANIFKKLEIKNVAELVRYALKQGIVRF